jgi:hypothetical protein
MLDNDKVIDFFERVAYMEPYTRYKTIYELTNNLDINLFNVLKHNIFEYHCDKIRDAMYVVPDEFEHQIDSFFYEVLHSFHIKLGMSEFAENFIERYREPKLMETFIDIMDVLLSDFNHLEKIIIEKIKKENEANNTELSEFEIEFIDEHNIPIIRRIIYLKKLGVIDFLRKEKPFNTSINSLANVLSGIIDAKPTSIQPLLNIMLNGDDDNPKNPLNSAKNVSAVENYLIKIGYPLK